MIEVVISRFAEDISWLQEEPFTACRLTCYNKGTSNVDVSNIDCQVFPLPNVGRDAHTILHHVIERYDDLSDVTLFLQGCGPVPNVYPCQIKLQRIKDAIRLVQETQDTVMFRGGCEHTREFFSDFVLDDWGCSTPINWLNNPESRLTPCPERPFGVWYDANFVGLECVPSLNFYCTFAVSREHIRQHPVSHYKKLIKYLDQHSNSEAIHYLERAWGAVFGPIPDKCHF